MKIFIGANSNGQLADAKQWLTDSDSKQMLVDLEGWATSREPIFGECYVFIEMPLPLEESHYKEQRFPSSHGQVDLLLAFSKGAALCELKGSEKASPSSIEKGVKQLRGQRKWLGELLRGRWGEDEIYPFLLLHKLYPSEMMAAAMMVSNAHSGIEIWPTGAHPKLRRESSSWGPLYLPDALERRLRGKVEIDDSRQQGIQELLRVKIAGGGSSLYQFKDFKEAENHLRYVVSDLHVRHDSWYVADTRPGQADEAGSLLARTRAVEVVGPPGVGKTTFAKEIILSGGYSVIEVTLRGCASVQDICRKIYRELHGDLADVLGEETYVQRLMLEPYLFWVRSHDDASASHVNEFFRIANGIGVDTGQALWIVESRAPVAELKSYRYELAPLEDQHISRILEKVEPGGAFADADPVIQAAKGNPGRAISLWRAQDADRIPDLDDVAWFTSQLTAAESRLLPILCLSASLSPLGVTAATFVSTACNLGVGMSDGEVRQAAATLIEKLGRAQLADVTSLNDETFGDLPNELIRSGTALTVINHVSSKLTEQVLAGVDDKKRVRLKDAFQETFLSSQQEDTLSHVTLALNLEDLEPFFRSSFRYTSMGAVVSWVDQTGWEPPDRRQSYLLKALRALSRMSRNSPSAAAEELGPPDMGDDVQRFASDFVNARSLAVRCLGPSFRLNSLLSEVSKRFTDRDVLATIYISLSVGLQQGERHQDTWNLLRCLPDKFPVGTTARALSVRRCLEFLNASKARKGVVKDDEAYPVITALAKNLVEEGIRVENFQLISEGVFYHTRAQEMRASKTSYSDVLSFRAALKFVEDVPQTRARHRLRIMLTQGSIHRHYCRDDKLSWDEFYRHFEEGMERYVRAFKSARAQGHTLHMLNAVSYMSSFCLSALRYNLIPESVTLIGTKSRDAVAYALELDEELVGRELWEREQVLLSNIRRNIPLLRYVCHMFAPLTIEGNIDAVKEGFSQCVEGVKNEVAKGEAAGRHQDCIKSVRHTLRSINRVFEYGDRLDPQRNQILLETVRPLASDILNVTRDLVTSNASYVGKEWRRLSGRIANV